MRLSRAVTAAEKSGAPLPPMAPSAPDPSLVPCANCGRSFSATAAERHIPKCASIVNKPTMLRRGAGVTAGSGVAAAAAAAAPPPQRAVGGAAGGGRASLGGARGGGGGGGGPGAPSAWAMPSVPGMDDYRGAYAAPAPARAPTGYGGGAASLRGGGSSGYGQSSGYGARR
jgi:hypothetical protein